MQKSEKTNDKTSRKCPKNRFFRHISGIFGRKKIFFENPAPSLFEYHHFASLCKKLETSDTFMDLPYNQENNEDLIEK